MTWVVSFPISGETRYRRGPNDPEIEKETTLMEVRWTRVASMA